MPKPSTFPTLYDGALQVSITKLKQWGYLNVDRWKGGTITWSCNGEQTASIDITVDMASYSPHIELYYKYRDEPRKCKIHLVSVMSNLGVGEVWYFWCPHTGKRCRILYSIGGWFLHREAFRGVYYDSQTRSKRTRYIETICKPYFNQDKVYKELYKPYFKTHYAGKPTKRYQRICKKLSATNSVFVEEFERLMAGL